MNSQPITANSDSFTAWILRSSAFALTAGCRVLWSNVPQYGDLVRVCNMGQNGHGTQVIFGLICGFKSSDDLVARQLILISDQIEPEILLDQQQNRLVPLEIDVLIVGHETSTSLNERRIRYGVAPQPPICLDSLTVCDPTELLAFSKQLAYMPLIINSPTLSPSAVDELLAAHLLKAASVRPPHTQRPFLVAAGRELARLLGSDLVRLNSLLRRIRPQDEIKKVLF